MPIMSIIIILVCLYLAEAGFLFVHFCLDWDMRDLSDERKLLAALGWILLLIWPRWWVNKVRGRRNRHD
jgi:hypothetical protein